MRAKTLPFLVLFLSVTHCICHAAELNGPSKQPETISFGTAGGLRQGFPKGFVFGTATSAYQVEGMADKDGRGPSIWDAFVKIPGIVANNATGEVSVDQYHRYKVDGAGKVNWNGVAYYNRLIDYMIERGITPYANLYHYDLPLALEKKYNGLLSNQVVFIHPIVYGEYPKTMQNIVGSRLPKFTEEEVKMVKGSMDFVGINHYTTYYMYDPHQSKPKNLGYQQDWNAGFAYKKKGVEIGPRANSYWLYNVPWGMYKAVMYIKERYGNPTMILSENGMSCYFTS
ncbi:hypothetical protein POTOM_049182 [Populus tomentosa]|uniref:Uncharacterized protein n=1 Tax=Populus tomentosa TaxID=118781 RepID=A0A8X7YKA3_POPTO|nr:hypothetical protein POTOM_049182 [Populus tomentosa]